MKVAIWRLFLFFLHYYLVYSKIYRTFVRRKFGTGSIKFLFFLLDLKRILR